MASPKTTHWTLDSHTAAKHALLHSYLKAWVPILSHGGFPEIVYIDAFAGPGRYSGGEEGSPLLALRAILEQRTSIQAKVQLHFIELDKRRAAALVNEVNQILQANGAPSNIRVKVHQDSFESAYQVIKSELGGQSRKLPTFAFIDPFGWTGLPSSIMRDLLGRPSAEVFVNLMFEEINRFIAHPDQIANFDSLFGNSDWKVCLNLSGKERNACIRAAYESMLKNMSKYVRYFEMRNARNATDYYLFFATQSFEGLKKMKASMWALDKAGDFRFSDATDPTQVVMFNEPDYRILKAAVLDEFLGRSVAIEGVERFVVERTAFRETHLRKPVLVPLEIEGKILLHAKPGRRKGQFPPGTILRFPA